jgi:L-asparagine oxygenase
MPFAPSVLRPEMRQIPTSLSSRHGLGEFPFHTDTAHWDVPARYLVLHCENPGRGLRPTLLQDSRNWALNREHKSSVLRDVWKCGYVEPRLCTVGQKIGDRLAVRFDEACMRPLTARAIDLRNRLRSYIEECPKTRIEWAPGDILILDNHRMLHARGTACTPDFDRVIRRALLGEIK